ncbi:MAG TPA: DUF6455 family protein [Burkholderiales bacterium]|jgi:hypothetical protein
MQTLSISVTLLLLFAAVVAALPFIYAAWRRISAREADLQIWRVMARRGIVADDAPASQAKLARAVRRCVLCPSIEQCDHWLASDGETSLAEFCPNATLLDELGAKHAK